MTEETSLELERGIVAAMHPQLQEQERRKPKISTWNNCRGLASAETAFRVWPTTGKQLCTISHCTGNWPGLGHCEKFDTISWKEERDEISSQRNSLKTKREKHYLTALGLLLNWIKHHDLVTQRYLWAPLIPAQETDLSSGQSQTSPSPLPRACHNMEWSGLCGNPAVSLYTHSPWSCSSNRWQMLFREAKPQIMSLGGEKKEPECLPDERVLQQHQPGRERPGRHCRKTLQTCRSQKTANRLLALLIHRSIINQEWQV